MEFFLIWMFCSFPLHNRKSTTLFSTLPPLWVFLQSFLDHPRPHHLLSFPTPSQYPRLPPLNKKQSLWCRLQLLLVELADSFGGTPSIFCPPCGKPEASALWAARWAEDKPGRPDVHFLKLHTHTQPHTSRLTFTYAPIELQRIRDWNDSDGQPLYRHNAMGKTLVLHFLEKSKEKTDRRTMINNSLASGHMWMKQWISNWAPQNSLWVNSIFSENCIHSSLSTHRWDECVCLLLLRHHLNASHVSEGLARCKVTHHQWAHVYLSKQHTCNSCMMKARCKTLSSLSENSLYYYQCLLLAKKRYQV